MDDTASSRTPPSAAGSTGTSRWESGLADYQAGNYDRLPHDEISQHYAEWSQSATPDETYEATRYSYAQLPRDQFGGATEGLYHYSREQGLDLTDLELSSPDYQQWTAEDAARVTGRAYSRPEKPAGKSGPGGIPKPIIGLALAGALAFAASRVMGEHGTHKQETQQSRSRGMPESTVTVDLPASSAASGVGSGSPAYSTSSSGTAPVGSTDYARAGDTDFATGSGSGTRIGSGGASAGSEGEALSSGLGTVTYPFSGESNTGTASGGGPTAGGTGATGSL